ncbi:hypothetical protein C8Q78DRAFT_1082151 [Trametes maxima]|nr:hypothetical protein C8Q78DRAFT_1082151 [Trametes maxima]
MRETGPERATYTNNTRRMAKIAADFYDELQEEGAIGENEDHEGYIREALEHVEARLTNTQKAKLARKLTREEVAAAVRAAAANKAPGLDGLPVEVWKEYLKWFEVDVKKKRPAADPKGRTSLTDGYARYIN